MRLISVCVRNYRVHREFMISFDRSRTLIGGPNEVGKSTLIEAIHRVLFLKAKGTGKPYELMRSMVHVGVPEVELQFEAGGQSWTLRKQFGKDSATLTRANSPALRGDAAETELARLLGYDAATNATTRLAQWSHLWVWQGEAGVDPVSQATAQKDTLVARLQSMGGSAVLQSALDAQVANRFADAMDLLFTKTNRIKVGSELERATSDAEQAKITLALATERLQSLESAANQFDDATNELVTVRASLKKLKDTAAELQAKSTKLLELQHREVGQEHVVEGAQRERMRLGTVLTSITKLQQSVLTLTKQLEPQSEKLESAQYALQVTDQSVQSLEAKQIAAAELAAVARSRHQVADLSVRYYVLKDREAKLHDRAAVIENRRNLIQSYDEGLAKLPPVDQTSLKKLQSLDAKLAAAITTLQAMAAGIEVVAAKETVLVDGAPVAPGETQIVTEDSAVTIGSAVRLRITPGGGTSLASARAAVNAAESKLHQGLCDLEVGSVEEAIEVFAARQSLTNKRATVQAELSGIDADSVAGEQRDVAYQLQELAASLERKTAEMAVAPMPKDSAHARQMFARFAEDLAIRESDVAALQASLKSAKAELKALESSARQLRTVVAANSESLRDQQIELKLLTEAHGDDATRNATMIAASSALDTAKKSLDDIKAAIGELGPEELNADSVRIDRAIQSSQERQNELQTRIELAKQLLRSDGVDDPHAEHATANAKAHASQRYLGGVQRKADAVVLLNRLFKEQQSQLSDLFTQPLAEAITGYLQCVFGPEASAEVKLEDDKFKELQFSRSAASGGTFLFSSLSGGAKEQVAAAFRLAMAEVLAQDEPDGCLPLVFDDAFTNSDAGRVDRLQRMLDRAATRGLQIIVLTCQPEVYAPLGASAQMLG